MNYPNPFIQVNSVSEKFFILVHVLCKTCLNLLFELDRKWPDSTLNVLQARFDEKDFLFEVPEV